MASWRHWRPMSRRALSTCRCCSSSPSLRHSRSQRHGFGARAMRLDVLGGLIAVFVPLSLAAVGGMPSIYASMQHQSVDLRQWVTSREFVELFAISRGTPGPGAMLVTLIGWKVAGWVGALTATAA